MTAAAPARPGRDRLRRRHAKGQTGDFCGGGRRSFLRLGTFVLILCAGMATAQEQAAPTVRLATIDPGDIYWQRFGHNALVVDPAADGQALSYNFGYFDFAQPDFLRRFLLGRMLYQALAIPAGEDLALYASENRSVHLQSLSLTAGQADRLARLLDEAVAPENRDYLYEYFRANCSTRIRDALDAALDGAIRRQTAGRSRGSTYRMHAMRLAQDDFWLSTGIDLGLGPDTDRPLSFWDEMFIPELMREHLREVRNADGTALVSGERAWFDSGNTVVPTRAPDRRAGFAFAGLAGALVLAWLARRTGRQGGARKSLRFVAASLHLLFGLAGSILLFLWLGTDHVAAHRNENLFLLSPLSLLLAPLWLRAGAPSPAVRRSGTIIATIVFASAAMAMLVKTLPAVFFQANLHWCLLLLPIHLALLLAWRKIVMEPLQ